MAEPPFLPRQQWYKLIGRLPVPVDGLLDWAIWMEGADRQVADTAVGPMRVSTVFLGLDHRFGPGDPLLFETMIFGDGNDDYQTRCSTWGEAEKMHTEAVRIAERRLAGDMLRAPEADA